MDVYIAHALTAVRKQDLGFCLGPAQHGTVDGRNYWEHLFTGDAVVHADDSQCPGGNLVSREGVVARENALVLRPRPIGQPYNVVLDVGEAGFFEVFSTTFRGVCVCTEEREAFNHQIAEAGETPPFWHRAIVTVDLAVDVSAESQ